MTQGTDQISFYLSIPCYNEGDRLAQFLPGLCTALSKSDLSVEIQIVDDGSEFYDQGHYRTLMDLLCPTFPFLKAPLTLEENQGKGNAVYAGWAEAGDADMVAFADADGAVGPNEVVRVLTQIANDSEAQQKLYAASRVKNEETDVNRRAIRNLGGLTFRWLRKRLFSFPIEDTQCGFKVAPRQFFADNQSRFKEGRFAFDIELLYHAQNAGLQLTEVPVTWADVEGGHINLLSSFGLFKDLLKLKGRLDKEAD